jgi:DNA-binding PadR family transcriptional regulator
LERQTGREVATAAVFVALQRLKAKGLLTDRMVPAGVEGGHARRYFHLTPKALDAMRESRQSFLSLWDGVESVLDDSGR